MSAIGYFLILDQPIRGKQRREGELICRIFLMFLVPGNDFQAWKISSQTAVMRADGKTGSVQCTAVYVSRTPNILYCCNKHSGYALASNE
jgi:hypothetical protein